MGSMFNCAVIITLSATYNYVSCVGLLIYIADNYDLHCFEINENIKFSSFTSSNHGA